ncbi:hypothetical protein VTN96DRAFT_3641 [Rasamsonia emersonii]
MASQDWYCPKRTSAPAPETGEGLGTARGVLARGRPAILVCAVVERRTVNFPVPRLPAVRGPPINLRV